MGMNQSGKGPMAEINVTPLVDVMLVLLVIFMVTAPMLFSGIDLKLPKTKKVSTLNLKTEFAILSINKEGEYFLGKNLIPQAKLIDHVVDFLQKNKQEVVFIRADYSLRYEAVAKLIAQLKTAGISQISLVTETEK